MLLLIIVKAASQCVNTASIACLWAKKNDLKLNNKSWMASIVHHLRRWELLGVWCWEADQRTGVHQEFGPISVRDPGGTALGPRLHLQHLLLQVRQLLEVQSRREPCWVYLPTQHAGLERHPRWCGCHFQGHLWYRPKNQKLKKCTRGLKSSYVSCNGILIVQDWYVHNEAVDSSVFVLTEQTHSWLF